MMQACRPKTSVLPISSIAVPAIWRPPLVAKRIPALWERSPAQRHSFLLDGLGPPYCQRLLGSDRKSFSIRFGGATLPSHTAVED